MSRGKNLAGFIPQKRIPQELASGCDFVSLATHARCQMSPKLSAVLRGPSSNTTPFSRPSLSSDRYLSRSCVLSTTTDPAFRLRLPFYFLFADPQGDACKCAVTATRVQGAAVYRFGARALSRTRPLHCCTDYGQPGQIKRCGTVLFLFSSSFNFSLSIFLFSCLFLLCLSHTLNFICTLFPFKHLSLCISSPFYFISFSLWLYLPASISLSMSPSFSLLLTLFMTLFFYFLNFDASCYSLCTRVLCKLRSSIHHISCQHLPLLIVVQPVSKRNSLLYLDHGQS